MKLTRIERRWAHAVFDTIFPAGSHPDLSRSIDELGLDGYLDDLGDSFPVATFGALRAAVAIIALAPPVVLGRLRTIEGLETEDRVELIARLYKSPVYVVRQLITMVKALGAIHYFAKVEVRRGKFASTGAPVSLRRSVGDAAFSKFVTTAKAGVA